MKKQTPKSAEKMAFNSFSNNSFSSFSKKFTAATVAAILAGSAVSMFGATANTAFASDVTVSNYAHPATSYDSTSAKSTASGLFASVMDNESFTRAQRDDAAKAFDILHGFTEKPDWYDSKVKLNSGEDSPDNITRLNNSISYMRAINEYRKSRGLKPLGVSLYTTAVAINDAFYSANVFGHAKHYKTFENLAWGSYDSGIYDGGNTTDTMTGAMKLWITDEKAKYDDFIAKGVSDEEINSKYYLKVGHYLNFIHPALTAMGLTSGNISDQYGTVISWEAVPASYLEGNKAPFTLDEYQKLINAYVNGQHYDVTPSEETPSEETPAPAPVPSEETPSDVPGVEHDVTPSEDVTPSDFDFTPSFDVTPSEDAYTPSDFDFSPSFDVTPSEDTPSDFDFTPSFDVTPSEDTPSDFDFSPSFDVTPSEDTPSDFDFTPSFDEAPASDSDSNADSNVTPSDFTFDYNFDAVDARRFD